MTEGQIVDLLQTGSYNAFLDCLDFAPNGIIDLIKKYAVSLPLNDYEKRKALKAKTGFDVDKAIATAEQIRADELALAKGEPVPTEDKPAATVEAAPAGRRTSVNYKIVETK